MDRYKYNFSPDHPVVLDYLARLDAPKWFADFGAGTGSDTLLLADAGWRGLWVEQDQGFCDTMRGYGLPNVVVRNALASIANCRELISAVPRDFGFLSIDIDGNDYWLWAALCGEQNWRPWFVMIEATLTEDPEFVMPYDAEYRAGPIAGSGAGVAALIKLGATMGYALAGRGEGTPNLYFIREDKYDRP
jgi:hypothetical protein